MKTTDECYDEPYTGTCPDCEGTGRVECDVCEGEGGTDTEVCAACNGDGGMICPECDGAGEATYHMGQKI